MGTIVVTEVARLLGSEAKALILVDQMHQTDYPFDTLAAESFYNDAVSSYKHVAVRYKSVKDSLIAVKIVSLKPPDEKLPSWWKPSLINGYKWLSYDLKPCVSKLKIPIRAINASNQKTNEEQWESFYRDYKVDIFENSNHFLFWQYPQKFNETLLKIIAETSKVPK